MEWFDDFFPDWDDMALAAAMGEEFAEDDEKKYKNNENNFDGDDFDKNEDYS